MVKGEFSDDSGNRGKPADARVSRGSGVLVAACRMDADTLPNRNRKLFPDVSNGFLSFPLVFRYSRDLFGTLISACSARVCSNPCGQKRFPLKRTESVFYSSRRLHCNSGQRVMQVVSEDGQLKDCAAIDKE